MASPSVNLAALRDKAAKQTKEAAAAVPSIKGAAPDEMLHQYVRQLAGAPAGYRAIWLRLSRLNPAFRREKHVQIACKVVEELIKHFTGRVFVRPNGDIVLISQEMKDKIIRYTAELLRNVFEGDAVKQGADHLCAIYDLESDYPRFVSALLATPEKEKERERQKEKEKEKQQKAAPRAPAARRPAEPPRRAAAGRTGKRAAARRPSRRYLIVFASIAVVALIESFIAYRSSQTPWVFDSAEAQKRHQLRNSWTGEYSFGK